VYVFDVAFVTDACWKKERSVQSLSILLTLSFVTKLSFTLVKYSLFM